MKNLQYIAIFVILNVVKVSSSSLHMRGSRRGAYFESFGGKFYLFFIFCFISI